MKGILLLFAAIAALLCTAVYVISVLEEKLERQERIRKHEMDCLARYVEMQNRAISNLNREQQVMKRMIFEWARMAKGGMPELELLHHIPNGGYRTRGEAGRLKAAGVKSGVPDLCLPVARHGFYGLYIELKAEGGKLSGNQKYWLESLRDQGYCCAVCFGAERAIKLITEYLKKT